jgi:hypothetical protein
MIGATTDKLLTADDVAARWGVAVEYVWDAVDDPESPLPFIYLGRGTPKKGRAGQRGHYRFRLAALESWERARERAFRTQGQGRDVEAIAALATFEHDGKVRGGRKGKAGPRG